MGYGVHTVYRTTMAAAAVSAVVDVARAYDQNYLVIPSMASVANIDVYASTNGQAYYQVSQNVVASGTTQNVSFSIAASAAANGRIVPIPAGFRYYKFIADSAPAAATTFQVICGA